MRKEKLADAKTDFKHLKDQEKHTRAIPGIVTRILNLPVLVQLSGQLPTARNVGQPMLRLVFVLTLSRFNYLKNRGSAIVDEFNNVAIVSIPPCQNLWQAMRQYDQGIEVKIDCTLPSPILVFVVSAAFAAPTSKKNFRTNLAELHSQRTFLIM